MRYARGREPLRSSRLMVRGRRLVLSVKDESKASFGYEKLRFKSQIVWLFAPIHNATETIRVQIVENNRTI